MEVMDSRPGDPENDLSDAEPPTSQRGHWLSGLVRADALALTSAAAAICAFIGFPAVRDAVNLFMFSPQADASMWIWVWLPPLIAAALAVVVGLLALRRADAQDSPGWVRAVAGSATVFGVLTAIGLTIMWLYAPDPRELFGPGL
ncbi:MAG TPA: hypothetical protein VF082_02855 [Jiangellaceae bacterium]